VALLSDFGRAKSAGGLAGTLSMSGYGKRRNELDPLRTLKYRAPEVSSGIQGEWTHPKLMAADVFSLAAMLNAVLAGTGPYPRIHEQQRMVDAARQKRVPEVFNVDAVAPSLMDRDGQARRDVADDLQRLVEACFLPPRGRASMASLRHGLAQAICTLGGTERGPAMPPAPGPPGCTAELRTFLAEQAEAAGADPEALDGIVHHLQQLCEGIERLPSAHTAEALATLLGALLAERSRLRTQEASVDNSERSQEVQATRQLVAAFIRGLHGNLAPEEARAAADCTQLLVRQVGLREHDARGRNLARRAEEVASSLDRPATVSAVAEFLSERCGNLDSDRAGEAAEAAAEAGIASPLSVLEWTAGGAPVELTIARPQEGGGGGSGSGGGGGGGSGDGGGVVVEGLEALAEKVPPADAEQLGAHLAALALPPVEGLEGALVEVGLLLQRSGWAEGDEELEVPQAKAMRCALIAAIPALSRLCGTPHDGGATLWVAVTKDSGETLVPLDPHPTEPWELVEAAAVALSTPHGGVLADAADAELRRPTEVLRRALLATGWALELEGNALEPSNVALVRMGQQRFDTDNARNGLLNELLAAQQHHMIPVELAASTVCVSKARAKQVRDAVLSSARD